MSQEQDRPKIKLAVHESADPSIFSSNQGSEASGEVNDLNDSVHDFDNADFPTPEPANELGEENVVNRQTTIANLSAG